MTNITDEPSRFTKVNRPSVFEIEQPQKQAEESKEKELNIMGIKLSYSKAFGIVFLLIFILLFFPGIGISSSDVKAQGEKGLGGMENKKTKR